MSKADEMFLNLGYIEDIGSDYGLIRYNKDDKCFVRFILENKKIEANKIEPNGDLWILSIDMKLLQAINEKVEELRVEFIKNKCLCERDYEEIDDYYILSINDVKKTLQIIQNRDGNFGMLLGEIPIKHCPECGKRIGCDQMDKELEEAIKVLKRDINTPLACGDTTIVCISDLETALNHIKNSISKEVIKEKIEEVRKMKFEDERLNGATIDFAACKFEKILEGK